MVDKAVILSTGDELITGRVVDTNSAAIADRLFSAGVEVAAILKVGDDREKLLWAFHQARDLGDLVIGTGGFGPTADDLTTELVAELLDRKLKQYEQYAAALKRRVETRGISWTANNLEAAQFPQGWTLMHNKLRT